jgi:DNA-binding transcriptional LysR family regulator
MNLRNIDLNLLVIFDALITERSVTSAAHRVGISPSAVSHALRRLRRTFGDDLLQRTPHGMEPTRRALDLVDPVRSALQGLQHAFEQQFEFNPRTSERSFRVSISDFLVHSLLPRIVARMGVEAPKVTLIAEHPFRRGRALPEPGEIQLRACSEISDPNYKARRLLRSPFVVAARRDHPGFDGNLSLERYVGLRHLDISSADEASRRLEDGLAQQDLSRRIVLTVPSLSGVMAILEHTDLCAILPASWVKLHGDPGRIVTAPLPLEGVEFTIDLIWHRRDKGDPGHQWLRAIIEQEFEVLYSAASRRLKRSSPPSPHQLDLVPPRK